ncbi:DNA-processing protein DprA [Candidatus Parcubacteria bacterium]|nr:DNA-processing protein DprA [Candidatus Parcubacteria bacterium]
MKELLGEFPIKEITLKDEDFPDNLKNIPQAPQKLYFRGILPLSNEKCFAIVGTRRATEYGKEQAFRFAKELSQSNLTIVSGMAMGVDTMAHKGALAGSGKTIAILGTGLAEKTIYPQENLKIAKEILEKEGCLISEYEAEQRSFASYFLKRNGLISALSLGVLVIEAKIKSGALNTANWAQKQKKQVFALPGNITSLNSMGCNLLIQQGAILTQNPKDVLNFFKISYDKIYQGAKGSKEEVLILKTLQNGALTADQLIEKTNLKPEQVLRTISLLELEDKIKNIFGNSYIIV